jgi:hypothetical protein
MPTAERVRHEVREIGLVTLYFLACFLFFLSMKALLLDEYHIETPVLSTAIIGALVVAKVVVLLDKTSLGERFASSRLLVHVLWRSLVYTAVAFVVTLAERLFDLYRRSGDLSTSLTELWAGEDVDHFLALNLTVGLSLLVYNVFAEIERHLGGGALRDLFLAERRRRERA